MKKKATYPTCYTCQLLPFNKEIGVLEPAIDFRGYRCSINSSHVFGVLDWVELNKKVKK